MIKHILRFYKFKFLGIEKPVVIEVDGQDVIAIRHMMYLSHTYDHRVVDGQLGGLFVKKMSDFFFFFYLHQEI